MDRAVILLQFGVCCMSHSGTDPEREVSSGQIDHPNVSGVDFASKLERLNQAFETLVSQQTAIQALLGSVEKRISSIEEAVERSRRVVARMSRNAAGRPTMIRVLFIIHFAENWNTIRPLILAMLEAPDFDPIVVTVDASFLGELPSGENELHLLLEKEKIAHLRWQKMDGEFNKHLLHYLDPDVVFRQSAWDGSVPDALRTPETSTKRICYIPYTLDLTEDSKQTLNLEMHHAAWRIFVPSELHVKYFREKSLIGGRNAVAVGHPGLDSIVDRLPSGGEWPIAESANTYRVIWAPHHSINSSWLGFATFPFVYKDILTLARKEQHIQFVFRAHKLLFRIIEQSGVMTSEEFGNFLEDWRALPNACIDTSADYRDLFAASDLLLTDGISFLAEYQVVGKPIIFVERDGHSPFNIFGKRVYQGLYIVRSGSEAVNRVLEFCNGADDILKNVRAEIASEMTTHPRRSVDLIMDEIRTGLALERGSCE